MAGVKTPDSRLGTAKRMRDAADWGAKIEFGTYAFDSEYVTDGEAFSTEGFKEVVGVWLVPRSGYIFEYSSAGLVLVYEQSSNVSGALTQVASSTDLSGLSDIPYLAFGF